MTLLGVLILLVVAAVAGAFAQLITGYSVGGCIMSTLLGLIGAFVGYWLADFLNLPPIFVINVDGQQFPFVWSIIGAVLFVLIISLITKRPATD